MDAPADEDFEEAGLLDGLEGAEREARLKLLRFLADEDVSLEEMSDAVAAGRLALVPVERVLEGDGPRYTATEVAERAGLSLDELIHNNAALGLPTRDPDERVLTEADVEAAKRLREIRNYGLPDEGILQVTRTLGMATSRIAEANRELVRSLIDDDASEFDLATRLAAAAEVLTPLVGPMLTYAMEKHLLEQVRQDVIASGFGIGSSANRSEVSVCFADMVGFTKLGERIAMDELGRVAGHLEEMALAAASGPVRLVKLIGDAVMLVSSETEALAGAAIDLVESAEEEGDRFPQLRAGIARGEALSQAGDWYGRPVNLASRVTSVARPGSVLVTESVKDAVGEDFTSSFAGERRLKGIDGQVKLFRLRRAEPDGN